MKGIVAFAVCAVLAVPLGCGTSRSSVAMTRFFRAHEGEFERLRHMCIEDLSEGLVDTDILFLRRPRESFPWGERLTLSRYREYEALVSTLHLYGGIACTKGGGVVFMLDQPGFSGKRRGYEFFGRGDGQPSPVVENIDEFVFGKRAREDITLNCYSPLGGNWYLLSQLY